MLRLTTTNRNAHKGAGEASIPQAILSVLLGGGEERVGGGREKDHSFLVSWGVLGRREQTVPHLRLKSPKKSSS